MAIRSLATSNVFRVEGSSNSSMWYSPTGESIGTGLDGPLCRPKVGGGIGARFPDMGCMRLALSPVALTVSERLLSVFL